MHGRTSQHKNCWCHHTWQQAIIVQQKTCHHTTHSSALCCTAPAASFARLSMASVDSSSWSYLSRAVVCTGVWHINVVQLHTRSRCNWLMPSLDDINVRNTWATRRQWLCSGCLLYIQGGASHYLKQKGLPANLCVTNLSVKSGVYEKNSHPQPRA